MAQDSNINRINKGVTTSPNIPEPDSEHAKDSKIKTAYKKGRKVIVKQLKKLNFFSQSASTSDSEPKDKKLSDRNIRKQSLSNSHAQSKKQTNWYISLKQSSNDSQTQPESKTNLHASLKDRPLPPVPSSSQSLNGDDLQQAGALSHQQPSKNRYSRDPGNTVQSQAARKKTITSAEVAAKSQEMFSKLSAMSNQLHGQDELHENKDLAGRGRFTGTNPPKKTVINLESFQNRPTHANKIDDNTIAAQGPSVFEKDSDSIPAFFSMAYEQDANVIVNLTNQDDYKPNDNPPLSVEYWPDLGEHKNYSTGSHQIIVKTRAIKQEGDYKIVTLELLQEPFEASTNSAPKKKIVQLYHYHSWKDHQATDLEKILKVKHEIDKQPDVKKVVHCRAGVGRTGTFIMLDKLKMEFDRGGLTLDNLTSKIEDMVMDNRKRRGRFFVQKQEQFGLLYRYGLQLLGVSETDNIPPASGGNRGVRPQKQNFIEPAARGLDRFSNRASSESPPPLPPRPKKL